MTERLVHLLVADELRLFLPARHRGGPVALALDGTSSLGHLVESVGVPLPEVGDLVVRAAGGAAGLGVGRSYQPVPGDTATVDAAPRPQAAPPTPPRFLLDVHLGALARRLRVLGIDASYRNDADDDELVARALAEDRVLLTQDRRLLMRRALRAAGYVRGSRPDDQLRDVLDRFAPATAPFTRCTACNGVLVPVDKESVADELEPGTRRSYDTFARCRDCRRVYWQGAHAARLRQLLG